MLNWLKAYSRRHGLLVTAVTGFAVHDAITGGWIDLALDIAILLFLLSSEKVDEARGDD